MNGLREKLKDKKFVQTLVLCLIATLLLIACYFVFLAPKEKSAAPPVDTAAVTAMSERETRLCSILSEIEGVGKIEAFVHEDETGRATGAILVFEGADNFSVRLDVQKAAALALGVEQKSVQIYKMNDE